MRDLLIAHLDGAQVPVRVADHGRSLRLQALAGHGFVRFIGSKGKPRASVITDRGREALCAALSNWIEALVRAQKTRDEAMRHDLGKVAALFAKPDETQPISP